MGPMKRLLLSVLAGLVVSCAATGGASGGSVADAGLARLAATLTGHFDSAAQAAEDEAFFDIRLVMQPIWPDRADGPWLYVEQARSVAADRPYRQRVYHLVRDAEGLRSDVFTLPGDEADFVAAWEDPDAFAGLTPDDLVPREGCSILLDELEEGLFVGATVGTGCGSSLGEAAYATSEVTLEPNRITSWDRGWTAGGEQAWGAETGPYVFLRLE